MKLILPILTLVLVSAAPAAWALPDLNETVESFTAKVKSSGSYGAITEFIDWPSLYRKFSPEELTAAGVGTPADLKRLVDAFLTNPARMLDLEWQKKEAELTPLQREMMLPRFMETKAQAVQR
jgi:hypothetical protein